MNEVSNFCNLNGKDQVCVNANPNACPTLEPLTEDKCCLACETVDQEDRHDFPPYDIGNGAWDEQLFPAPLSYRTLPMSADHHGGVKEYDAHNLYGLMEARATAEGVVAATGRRPFVLSRSTFPGHGAHAAHWLGDNAAEWGDLRAALHGVLNFNLFGVPMVGSDVCGFVGTTTEELCARWMALGAFQPFSRNHNDKGAAPQEPYRWDSVAAVSRLALALRYRLLPHLYSLFFDAHSTGSLVAAPLWAAFPADAATHAIDEQFLLGANVLVSPALHEGSDSVDAYFPCDTAITVWYSLTDYSSSVECTVAGTGQRRTLDTPTSTFNVHARSGSILPLHGALDATGAAPLTTVAARALPYDLLVALPGGGAGRDASGTLFLDDGEQVDLVSSTRVAYAAIAGSSGGSVSGTVEEDGCAGAAAASLGSVTVLGLGSSLPASATVNGVAAAAQLSGGAVVFDLSAAGLSMNQPFSLVWEM